MISKANRQLLFLSASMLMVGLQVGETGAALDLMTSSLSLSPGQQALIVSVRAAGGVVAGLFIWLAATRLRIGLILGLVHAAIVGSLAILPGSGFAGALGVSVIRGLAAGAVVPLSGIFASQQTDRSPGAVAATVNAAVSAGLFLVSVTAAALSRAASPDWRLYWIPSAALSALCLLLLPFSGFAGKWQRRALAVPERLGSRVRRQFSGTAWVFAVGAFFLVGAEIMIFGLIPARSVNRGPVPLSGEVYALIVTAGVLAGRLAASGLLRRFRPGPVAGFAGAAVAVSALLWSAMPDRTALWVACMGLSTAAFFPSLIGLISLAVPSRSARTIGAAGWTGGLGGVVVPALVGLALERGSWPGTPGIAIATSALVAVLLFAYGLRRYSEVSGSEPVSPPGSEASGSSAG